MENTTSPVLDKSPEPIVLRGPAAAAYLRMSVVTFQNSVKAGLLPAPIRLSPMRPVWRIADLNNVLASR